jgi:hypothetical protein
MDFITNNLTLLAGGGSAAVALFILKRIPNEKIYDFVETACFTAGKVMTLGLSKWKFTRKVWQSTIEPYFVDLVDNTVGAAVKGFIDGLRSDN